MANIARGLLVFFWLVISGGLVLVAKELFWSSVTDWLIKRLGFSSGAEMFTALAGIAAALGIAGIGVWGAYKVGVWATLRSLDQKEKPPARAETHAQGAWRAVFGEVHAEDGYSADPLEIFAPLGASPTGIGHVRSLHRHFEEAARTVGPTSIISPKSIARYRETMLPAVAEGIRAVGQ